MNLQQLRYACALAECESFVEAANRCAVTQPTLSNAIARLEEELGHKLFERTTRTVGLSETGKLLIPEISEVLNAHEALIAQASAMSNPSRRLIRVGVSPVIGIKFIDLLCEPFRSANETIDIVFREMNMSEMELLLEKGQLDIVFGPVDPTTSIKASWRRAVFESEPLVFVPSSHVLSKYKELSAIALEAICEETLVMVPDACGLTKTTRALFQHTGLPLREYLGQAMSYDVLQDWAELGIGSAILPRSKIKPTTKAAISVVSKGKPISIDYQCLWHQHQNLPEEIVLISSYMREVAPSIVKGMKAHSV